MLRFVGPGVVESARSEDPFFDDLRFMTFFLSTVLDSTRVQQLLAANQHLEDSPTNCKCYSTPDPKSVRLFPLRELFLLTPRSGPLKF